MAACDVVIRERGEGCCERCFQADTHGLLAGEEEKSEHRQELDNLTRLAAQAVIARGEHAREIRRLQADVGRLTEEVALLRGDQERADEGEKKRLLAEVIAEVRVLVRDLPERVKIVELCIEGIERKLGLTRKKAPQKAIGPGPKGG